PNGPTRSGSTRSAQVNRDSSSPGSVARSTAATGERSPSTQVAGTPRASESIRSSSREATAETVIRLAFVYLFILFALRVIGRREFSELTAFDLVTLLPIPEIVSQAILREDF